MTERFPITNLLLLLLLTSFLLISGSLQCAFDCLTRADHRHSAAVRVDDCHLSAQQPESVITCADKACHQSSPQRQDLDGPQLFGLNKLQHPLSDSTRLQLPQFRAGTALATTWSQHRLLLTAQNHVFPQSSQQLRSLRTTILLI